MGVGVGGPCMGVVHVVGAWVVMMWWGGYKCSVILPRLVMLEMGWGWEGPRLGH